MKKRLPIVIVIIAAAGGWLAYDRIWRKAGGDGRLTFSGNIELVEVSLSFKRPGRLLTREVDEGDAVAGGTAIARLDTSELERQRDGARAAVAVAEARLDMLEDEIRYLEESVQASIALRESELGQSRAVLRELEAGSRDQEIGQAEAAAERARTEWSQAQRDWTRIRGLHESGVVSRAERDAALSRAEATSASLEQARQYLDLLRAGTRSERIEAAEAAVERSKASLRAARAAEIELGRKKLERRTRRAELDGACAQLALIDTQLADSILTAPLDGVVLAKAAEPGEVLAAGTPVVTLGDLAHPWVRAYIPETDLGRVRLGDRALVRTDTFPDKVYEGRVSFIASEAEFTPKQIQTREERTKLVYRIKVDLPNPNQELKLNMPVEGEIMLAQEGGRPIQNGQRTMKNGQ